MRADLPSYQELLRETQQTLSEKLTTSPTEAARWVEAAAHNGSKPAIISWGQMLLDGYGVERDCSTALRWFTIAAQTGYPDAINMVGRCYEHGWGTERDTQEAARCYNLAAGMGHDWARFNLGMLFIAEDGIERDLKRALGLFVGAARQGNAKAMNMIGRYREEGWVGRSSMLPSAGMGAQPSVAVFAASFIWRGFTQQAETSSRRRDGCGTPWQMLPRISVRMSLNFFPIITLNQCATLLRSLANVPSTHKASL